MSVETSAQMERLLSLQQLVGKQQLASDLKITPKTLNRWINSLSTPPKILDDTLSRLELQYGFVPSSHVSSSSAKFRFIDLFAGIGGTRLAMESAGGECVFTSEWDKFAQQTYAANFSHVLGSSPISDLTKTSDGHLFAGDITKVAASDVPDHEVLVAGFPCQPFSIAGVSKKNALGRKHGFLDETQGTLFFDIARIIEEKKPEAFLLENVKNLVSHDKGHTFKVISRTLSDLGYSITYRVLSATPYVPQTRNRIIIVGFRDASKFIGSDAFNFDDIQPQIRGNRHPGPTMAEVLHPENGTETSESPYTEGPDATVAEKYTLTNNLWRYLQDYAAKHRSAGNGFGYGMVNKDSVARTLSARYYKDGSEILISRGENQVPRKLTPREAARLMGFPEHFRIPVSDTQAYKQFGNSVVVPLLTDVSKRLAHSLIRA
ncbi:DNA (cytosine-5-)-methyltransferase [Micrococcoides hystricis]|uniref:Cytosine-specific methyltransferase n=1 Tax=Micrococcoides hystricis TaxID=1572761 RepID=A0ABV6P9Y1_9MICC